MTELIGKTFAKHKIISGWRDGVIRDCTFLDVLELEGCNDVIIGSCTVRGGEHNILLHGCTGVMVRSCKLFDPVGASKNPNDTEGHAVLMDDCLRCSAVECVSDSSIPTGDRFNLFNSHNCHVDLCTVLGKLCKLACAGIIDGTKGDNCGILRMTIKVKNARLGIAGGTGHTIQGTTVPGAVEVTGEYYHMPVVNPVLVNLRGPLLYVDTATVQGLVETKCQFKVREVTP
jgi:hypothetical protein